MKKIASILLLGIFLFNWFGYRLVTAYLENQANTNLELALDNSNYDESDLISVKVASNLAYGISSTQFERADGEVVINGIHYKYVKRRIQNDSLELLCIRNDVKMTLENSKDNFFKLVNDLQHNSQNKKQESNNISKNILSEYSNEQVSFSFAAISYQQDILSDYQSASIPFITLSPQEQPPDA